MIYVVKMVLLLQSGVLLKEEVEVDLQEEEVEVGLQLEEVEVDLQEEEVEVGLQEGGWVLLKR
tara:strand:+ start:86 stop:274 length:189 start_codon:yes stop_codon:yes gene_type:complete